MKLHRQRHPEVGGTPLVILARSVPAFDAVRLAAVSARSGARVNLPRPTGPLGGAACRRGNLYRLESPWCRRSRGREHSRAVGPQETRGPAHGARFNPLGYCTRRVGSTGNELAGWVWCVSSTGVGGGP